ncbi:3-dehydroquinate dehydratase [Alphaproteobacteria bacterium]|nr:3-dehydroquinate dehydratase [Alphaproteobacteria bacterium]
MSSLVAILNGPNINMIGVRQPEIYGSVRFADIEVLCREEAKALNLEIVFRQSNHEGVLVDWIQEARETAAAIIINPGALTHTSVAIMDALAACSFPILELHLTNVHRREAFRRHSYVSKVALGVIAGFGAHGYALALRQAAFLICRPQE